MAANFKLIAENLSLRENCDLYYGKERVAIVYNRIIFRLIDFMSGKEGETE